MELFKKVYKHLMLEFFNKLFIWFIFPAFTSFSLRLLGSKIGKNCKVYTPLILHNTNFKNLIIGNNCHIGRDVFLDLADKIIIGDNVTISMRSSLITHTNVGESPLRHFGYESVNKEIIIESGVYIGIGATVLYGVKIGENSVIGASSLVLKNVEPYSVVAGIPAKTIKKIDASITYFYND